MPKFRLPNQTFIFWDILANISGLGTYFSKPIFALKPWAQAGCFEYHEPYNRKNFFSDLWLGLSTTLTSEDKNGDFETSLKVKNKDYILMYDGLGAKIENISTNEVIYPINHYFAL